VSISGYYSWRKGSSQLSSNREEELLSQIQEIYNESHRTYGSPRIFEELKSKGISVSRSMVARIMKKHGIRSVHAKKFKITTDSKHEYKVADNILNRNFKAEHKSEKWVSDITYIHTKKDGYI
jgi:putative transposase